MSSVPYQERHDLIEALPTLPLSASHPSAPSLSGHLDALMPLTERRPSLTTGLPAGLPNRTAPLRGPTTPPARIATQGPVLEPGRSLSAEEQWETMHIPAAVSAHLSWPGALGAAGAQARWEQFERMLHIATGVCCVCGAGGRAVNRRWYWKDRAGHMRSGGTRECLCRAHRREARHEGSLFTWLQVKLSHEGVGKCSAYCPGAEYAGFAGARALR